MGSSTTKSKKRGFLSSLFGGDSGSSDAATSTGTKTADGAVESQVAATAGKGATSGLPTASDDGVVTMTFHQV